MFHAMYRRCYIHEIYIRSILRDMPCSSIMHQISLKQENARTHCHPPYFPSLHLVHHHNSVLKTSYSLSATPATRLRRARTANIPECMFFRRQTSETICRYICIVHYIEKVESRAGPSEIQLYLPSLRIEFESKAPRLGGRARVVAADES